MRAMTGARSCLKTNPLSTFSSKIPTEVWIWCFWSISVVIKFVWKVQVSKLVLYTQSTGAVISGRWKVQIRSEGLLVELHMRRGVSLSLTLTHLAPDHPSPPTLSPYLKTTDRLVVASQQTLHASISAYANRNWILARLLASFPRLITTSGDVVCLKFGEVWETLWTRARCMKIKAWLLALASELHPLRFELQI